LEPHLEFLVHVVDDAGEVIAQSRSVKAAKEQLGVEVAQAAEPIEQADSAWSRTRMTTFDIEALPEQVVRVRGGVRVAQFPGLVDRGDHVATQLFVDAATAQTQSQRGLMRL